MFMSSNPTPSTFFKSTLPIFSDVQAKKKSGQTKKSQTYTANYMSNLPKNPRKPNSLPPNSSPTNPLRLSWLRSFPNGFASIDPGRTFPLCPSMSRCKRPVLVSKVRTQPSLGRFQCFRFESNLLVSGEKNIQNVIYKSCTRWWFQPL